MSGGAPAFLAGHCLFFADTNPGRFTECGAVLRPLGCGSPSSSYEQTLRRTMGRRGRRIAQERFTAEEMVQKYVQVYESLR